MFTDEERAIATATSRGKGAVGSNAVVPKIVRAMLDRGGYSRPRVLDFGAGKAAQHARALAAEYPDASVVAHDFHQVHGFHNPHAMRMKYDIVYASNVLNVQSSASMLRATLQQIAGALVPGGEAVVNYPKSPRKSDLSNAAVETLLLDYFASVERVSPGVWVCETCMGDDEWLSEHEG